MNVEMTCKEYFGIKKFENKFKRVRNEKTFTFELGTFS